MVSDLEVKTKVEGSVTLIKLKGQVDLTNGYQLREVIEEQLAEGAIKLLIDTKDLNFIDSSCLGILVSSLKKIREAEGFLVIVVNPYVERLITVAGLGSIFDIEDTVEKAIKTLKER